MDSEVFHVDHRTGQPGVAGRVGQIVHVGQPQQAAADRIAAQQALKALGFDPGSVDGVMGARTRAAARQWQTRKHLPADGYLTLELITQLKAEAGLSADGPPAAAPPSAGGATG